MTYKIMWLESMLCPQDQSFWNSGASYIWLELTWIKWEHGSWACDSSQWQDRAPEKGAGNWNLFS